MPTYLKVKRYLDIAVALAGLVLLSPLLVMISVGVKVDSDGPVLYWGERVGHQGRPFHICKFRTMRPNAELSGTTTAKDDPRITRSGGFLRKYKLDELPQLINVLKGEMSLVGPRPEVKEHTNEYDEREKEILTVLPGITDFSSVYFSDLGEVLGAKNAHAVYITQVRAQKNALRLKYVRDMGLRTDLKILARTVAVVARKMLPCKTARRGEGCNTRASD